MILKVDGYNMLTPWFKWVINSIVKRSSTGKQASRLMWLITYTKLLKVVINQRKNQYVLGTFKYITWKAGTNHSSYC